MGALDGLDGFVDLLDGRIQRLFAVDALAGLAGAHYVVGMGGRGRADQHGVHLVVREHGVRRGLDALDAHAPRPADHVLVQEGIDDVLDPDLREVHPQHLDVHPRDAARAEDGHGVFCFHGLNPSFLSYSSGTIMTLIALPAFSSSTPSQYRLMGKVLVAISSSGSRPLSMIFAVFSK